MIKIKLIGITVIIILSVLCVDAYNQNKSDYYFYMAEKRIHPANWDKIEECLILGIHYSRQSDFHARDRAGVIYILRVASTGDITAFRKGRLLLNTAQHLNPLDSYVLIHIVGMDLIGMERGIIPSKPSAYIVKTADYMLRLDKYNKSALEIYNDLKTIGGSKNGR